MKSYNQIPKLELALEKDEKNNKAEMQMRVWFLNNQTTILVRFFKHNTNAHKKLWYGRRTNGDVWDSVLNELYVNGVIRSTDNWEYSTETANSLYEQDEFEEKRECIYLAWNVKQNQLMF